MSEYHPKFTPWWECSPVPSRSTGKYFIGQYEDPRRGTCELWVNPVWNACDGVSSDGHGWEIDDPCTIPTTSSAYERLKFLRDFVLANWWLIVTQAPFCK